MAKRGNDILRSYAERIRAEKDTEVISSRCGHCDWITLGPLGEAREAFALHLSLEHPEIRPRKHRQRGITTLPKVSKKSLDENVAAARAQGASTWAEAL